MKVTAKDLKLVMGARLIDVDYQTDGDSDCGEEVILLFDNGQQLNIYVHPESGLVVEPD